MFQTTIDHTPITFDTALVEKYDRPGPRYTSYPTAPQWQADIDDAGYRKILTNSNDSARPLSLYVHLPFCESHCSFCGCNVVITKQKSVTTPYLADLARELALVSAALDTKRAVEQLHFGGGTPTYLTCAQLRDLFENITQHFHFAPHAEIGIEVDPRVTTLEQLTTLRALGFNRVSMGVQDLDPDVQVAINRVQPLDQTARLIIEARRLGFESVNVDLIYGLPLQTAAGFAETVDAMIALSPDRIACYSFAYVPWLKVQQRNIAPETLPSATEKLAIWCHTISQFAQAGYEMIGFDHFAKSTDELAIARRTGTLWRNFQGYTTKAGTDLVAFGITGIGDIDGHYIQNEKKIPAYRRALMAGKLPTTLGCHLTHDDRLRRFVIRELLCHQQLDLNKFAMRAGATFDAYFPGISEILAPLCADDLVSLTNTALTISPFGRLFARNVAMCFDAYLAAPAGEKKYSRTV